MSTRMRWVSGATDYGFRSLPVQKPEELLLARGAERRPLQHRAVSQRPATSLTRGIQRSTYVADGANDVNVRCIGDRPTTLTLEVNGHVIGQVRDAEGLASGNIGIRVGSGNRS